ncbi:uncharacterized protein PRCAT00003988001 [Priceomyces carsonii]|uniref:uncharacterized protein n=1 Tax=Priceomyces carsonii TaxID=28549 RepID=UPI002EDA1E52|nr:unnamed protein product [Priceomyces carsonii]
MHLALYFMSVGSSLNTLSVFTILSKEKKKKKNSVARFRSWDIRVMGPARFRCATTLLLED